MLNSDCYSNQFVDYHIKLNIYFKMFFLFISAVAALHIHKHSVIMVIDYFSYLIN